MGLSQAMAFLEEVKDPAVRKAFIELFKFIEDQMVTKVEFKELREAVEKLAEAQRGTEERLNRLEKTVEKLVEAQKRTEERLNQLTEAQKKTEERLNQLTEAQKRTEERLNQLTEAQKRTEERLNQLAEAQKKTEKEIEKLTRAINTTRREVGGLSRSVAYALENEAYRNLPRYLEANYNMKVVEKLIRTTVGGEEINLFGKILKNGKEAFLVGEAVLKLDDPSKLRNVWNKVTVVKEEFGGEVVPIIVTHFAKPEVLEKAKRAGILVVQSFEWI